MLAAFAAVVAGCATGTAPTGGADVGGRWTGTWSGYGTFFIPRAEDATLTLVQGGAGGTGSLSMQGTLAADSVPDSIRDAGMTPVRIVFDVSGATIRLTHELGPDLFEAELTVDGERMVGHALRTDPVVRFELTREKPRAASVPIALAPVARPSAPAPPPPVAGEPPSMSEESATTPPPAPRAAPPPSEFRAMPEVRTIHFDFDRSDIRAADAAILDANVEWLRANPESLVLIEGHCDERGTAEYNLALGERRALATKAYLVTRGVAETRLMVTSYGFERLLCVERAEACWARNRRAALLIRSR